MNWITNFFKPKSINQPNKEYFEGREAFIIGEKLWLESVNSEGSHEDRKAKRHQALEYFDQAIDKGYDNSKVFILRGSCLNDLGFYYEAIEDYTNGIERNPKSGIASNYHMRSLIKQSIFDYKGSIEDIKEAIRLSTLDNEDNRYWNNYAKETTRHSTATKVYEDILKDYESRYEMEKKGLYEDLKLEKLNKIRRRTL